MQIVFYRSAKIRKSPVYDFIRKLPPNDRLRILVALKNIEELGFGCSNVQFRSIRGKLLEIRIKVTYTDYYVFCVTSKQWSLVLLHVYAAQAQSQPLPKRVITVAEKRMLEILEDAELYHA